MHVYLCKDYEPMNLLT